MPEIERAFLDTNVVLYALSTDEPKRTVARRLLAGRPTISIQVLSEASSVLSRKFGMPKSDVAAELTAVLALAREVRDLDLAVLSRAWSLWQVDTIAWYDCLIVAAALETGCSSLLTEDLQAGRVFADQLTVKNPFVAPDVAKPAAKKPTANGRKGKGPSPN